jgi:hypothetical protein
MRNDPHIHIREVWVLNGHLCERQENVKLSSRLISYAPRHEDEWGSGGIAPSFLASALVAGERSASRQCRFNSWRGSSVTHQMRGWEGPRACLDGMERLGGPQSRSGRYGEAGWAPEPVWTIWRGWEGPRAGLDDVEKRKIFRCWNRTGAVHPVACHYTD